MRAVAGAIVVLAGAVVAGAGMVAEAVLTTAGRRWEGPTGFFIFAGVGIGFGGIGLLVRANGEERRP